MSQFLTVLTITATIVLLFMILFVWLVKRTEKRREQAPTTSVPLPESPQGTEQQPPKKISWWRKLLKFLWEQSLKFIWRPFNKWHAQIIILVLIGIAVSILVAGIQAHKGLIFVAIWGLIVTVLSWFVWEKVLARVPENERWVVQLYGRYGRTLTRGWWLLFAPFESVQPGHRISIARKEQDIERTEVITQDNVLVELDAAIAFHVRDMVHIDQIKKEEKYARRTQYVDEHYAALMEDNDVKWLWEKYYQPDKKVNRLINLRRVLVPDLMDSLFLDKTDDETKKRLETVRRKYFDNDPIDQLKDFDPKTKQGPYMQAYRYVSPSILKSILRREVVTALRQFAANLPFDRRVQKKSSEPVSTGQADELDQELFRLNRDEAREENVLNAVAKSRYDKLTNEDYQVLVELAYKRGGLKSAQRVIEIIVRDRLLRKMAEAGFEIDDVMLERIPPPKDLQQAMQAYKSAQWQAAARKQQAVGEKGYLDTLREAGIQNPADYAIIMKKLETWDSIATKGKGSVIIATDADTRLPEIARQVVTVQEVAKTVQKPERQVEKTTKPETPEESSPKEDKDEEEEEEEQ